MNKLDAILRLNKDFYKDAAVSFSKTRRGFWKGWGRVAAIGGKDVGDRFKVLDVGCGNGRFLSFIKKHFPNSKIIYTGLDNNDELLSQAKNDHPEGKFVKTDFLKNLNNIAKKKYDLVACFGVTHHIPTAKLRLDFFKMLGKSVNSGGYLVVTFWQFDIKKSYKIREFEKLLGKNDFILGWDNKPNLFRYCHLYDDKEKSQIDKLLNKSGLFLAEEFLDIGNDGAGSHYFIWRKN